MIKGNKLDLHGIKHADVYRVVDVFLYENIKKGSDEVYIITGYSSKMKLIVNEVLSDYKLSSIEDWGNYGKLIVKI
jgi:DNA-nicking Smr family endonuclease